jgi:hypothetical protein
MQSGRWWLAAGLVGLVALVGCAVGATEEGVGESDLANAPLEAGADDASNVKLPPPSNPGDDAGGEEQDGGAKTDSGNADAGADGGNTDGGTGTSCNATNGCATATDLGSISGDSNNDTKSAQGTTSAWFTVRVTENDSSIFGNSLEMKATLGSPAGANFDLFLYLPGDGSGRECSAVASKSQQASGTDQAGLEWGEGGGFSNGSSDDRTVTIEVRHVSGTCSPGAKWTLNLYGNQH